MVDQRLRIEQIRIYPFEIPLVKPFKIATMTNPAAKGVFVAIDAGGMTGWGECLPFHAINGENQATCIESLKFFAEQLLGKDAWEVKELVNACFSLLPAQTTAICGIDTALHDLASQSLDLPLWRYLGGSPRELKTDLTIGIVSPKEAQETAENIANEGFQVIKVKLGDTPLNDCERVEAVRNGAPGVAIRVDMNQAYDRETALQILAQISEHGVEFCEQPVKRGDWQGLRWLHTNAAVAVMADESCFSASDAFRLLSEGCCSLFNIKLCKSGGIGGAQEIASVVKAGHGRCMVGGMAETRLGVTASSHFACTNDVLQYFDLDAHMGHTHDPIQGGIQIVDGCVVLPTTIGLGAEPEAEFLKGLPVFLFR